MSLSQIPAGEHLPKDIYVIIEISSNSNPVKYEINKITGTIFVDRFISTPMFYPCNYGYINQTLSLDGDPIDVLVPTPYPLLVGSVIHCRPIGMLDMIDESGNDYKVIAVPHSTVSLQYENVQNIDQLPILLLKQIRHFFEHYKNLESKKWVKINQWQDVNSAQLEIVNAFKRFKKRIQL